MKHTFFKMKGNKHLHLRGIQSIEISPQERLQIILGTNGSGKSTVMRELSALCSDHTHFFRGGSKEGIIEKKGSVYEYLSDFTTDKNHYKIKKDGEVLYEGHVASAYNEYVKEALGVTTEIHDLSIGKIRFTEMDTSARRKWFTQLCPQDFTYAIGYYERLCESQRDITGAVKRLNDKLINEKKRLLDDHQQRALQEKAEKLKETKQRMLIEWRPMNVTFDDVMNQVEDADNQLLALASQLKKSLSTYAREEGFHTENQVHQEIGEVKAKIAYIDEKLDSLFDQLETNRQMLKDSVSLGDQDVKSIDAKITELSSEIAHLKNLKNYEHTFHDPVSAKDTLTSHYSELVSLINEIIADPEDTITIANTQSIKQSVIELEGQKNKNLQDISSCKEIIKAMEHRKNEGHTECPQCKFVWFKGYDETQLESAQSTIHGLEITNNALTKRIEELYLLVERNSREIQLYQQIVYICKATHNHLSHMWDSIMPDKLYKRDKGKALEIIQKSLDDLQIQIEINALQKQIDEQSDIRKIAVTTTDLNRTELITKNVQLDTELFNQNHRKRQLQLWLTRLDEIKHALEFQNRYEETVTLLLDKRTDSIKKAEILNEQSLISGILANLDKEITEIDRELGSCLSQRALVKSYEEQIQELDEKEKLLKIAIKVLSPQKGLIAEGLTGFINHFIAQMNAVIEKVWLYPLAINPITITEESLKLDYKFSFSVEDKPAGKDVKDGSGAQKEIFDLAFMLVSMKHLKLDDYPIFLDEFSIKMDYAHRREAMRMIMELLNSSSFSQIFMVSHYENSYGSISNADITVLCSENIEIPADLVYNKNATVVK